MTGGKIDEETNHYHFNITGSRDWKLADRFPIQSLAVERRAPLEKYRTYPVKVFVWLIGDSVDQLRPGSFFTQSFVRFSLVFPAIPEGLDCITGTC